MIVYICPKCKTELMTYMYPTNPPIHVKKCPKCGWKSEERERIVYLEAREAQEEKQ